MPNVKLTLTYDGSAYHGFQRQENALAIQQIVEEALTEVLGHTVKINGAGRTDTKVHALGQVISFSTTSRIPIDKIPVALLGKLPSDIVAKEAVVVPDTFSARQSAKSKKYFYRIYQTAVADPFLRHTAWHLRQKLDLNKMNQAAKYIEGTHDFSAFRAAGSTPVQPIRTMFESKWCINQPFITYHVWGTGFLYHMVRNLVGTMVYVGIGKLTLDEFKAIVAGKDRSKAGMTAPPEGLFLSEVLY